MIVRDQESVTGLDIGTSKITAIVAERDTDGAICLTGIGQSVSRGVRKGEIINQGLTAEDVHQALSEAEKTSDREIRSVFLGVTGGHLKSFINRGSHPVVSADRDITSEDVRDVVRNARAVNIPRDHHILHVVRQQFLVDGQSSVIDPVGMTGARLEVDLHVIHGQANRLQNTCNVVRKHRIEVEQMVFSGLASMYSVLSRKQKELGTLVLDFGGGTIDYVLCSNGLIRHSGVLPVAGDHISTDLAYGLKVSLGRAEALKIEHGRALCGQDLTDKTIEIPGRKDRQRSTVPLDTMGQIMSQRILESLEIVHRDLQQAGCLDMLRSEVVVTGGGARIRDIRGVAEHVFGVPASIGVTRRILGPPEVIRQPEFANAIGLATYGISERERKSRTNSTGKLGRVLGQLFRWQ